MNASAPAARCFGRLLATVSVAIAAAPRSTGAETPDVAWSDWLADAEVWTLTDESPPVEPAAFTAVAPEAFQPLAPPEEAPRSFGKKAPERVTGRIVRYEVPIDDRATHAAFAARGVPGELITVPLKAGRNADSTAEKYAARVASFFAGPEATPGPDEARVVRYEAPAEDIALHTEFAGLQAEVIEPGMLRLPEVRFFQPKARVYLDLKRTNDEQFDLFTDGSFLASLDVVELYFPMPLVSERFARAFGRPSRLSGLGWRVGGTIGLGITTAINDGASKASGSPISTLSAGLRYEFPLGRPSQELIATGDHRLDERTRVGIEGGLQGGLSTDESISESTDLGLYFGILVNTPWGG